MSQCGKHRSDVLNSEVTEACRMALKGYKNIRNLIVRENITNIFMSSQSRYFSLFINNAIFLRKNILGSKIKVMLSLRFLKAMP